MAEEKRFVVTGLAETVAGLKEFDKKALNHFRKVTNAQLEKVRKDAEKIVLDVSTHGDHNTPLSGWQAKKSSHPNKDVRGGAGWPEWNYIKAIAGLKISKAKGKVKGDWTTSAGALESWDAAAYIFELAGSANKPTSKAGRAFIDNLTKVHGKTGRLAFRALDANRAEVEKAYAEALEIAKASLQKALESQRTGAL